MTKEEEREFWARAILETLKASGLSVEKLAEALNVGARELRYWRSAQRRPTGIIAVRIYEFRKRIIEG